MVIESSILLTMFSFSCHYQTFLKYPKLGLLKSLVQIKIYLLLNDDKEICLKIKI